MNFFKKPIKKVAKVEEEFSYEKLRRLIMGNDKLMDSDLIFEFSENHIYVSQEKSFTYKTHKLKVSIEHTYWGIGFKTILHFDSKKHYNLYEDTIENIESMVNDIKYTIENLKRKVDTTLKKCDLIKKGYLKLDLSNESDEMVEIIHKELMKK